MLEAGVRAPSNRNKMPADIIHSIILIHGLQGQPFRTWAGDTNPAGTSTEKVDFGEESSSQANSQGGRQSASKMWRFLSRTKSTERHSAAAGDERTSQPFWPSDFLPNDCSEARIMVFGYNKAIVIPHRAGAVNWNSIFTHSKDLLQELWCKKPPGRPVIFVTHPLGGILPKETLVLCSGSPYPVVTHILNNIIGIVFMGTPHRGSPAAHVGEISRKLASFVLMDTNAWILDSLCLKNSDLERCQDAFSALWLKYNFRVKTFQEKLPPKLPVKFGQSRMSKVTQCREIAVEDFALTSENTGCARHLIMPRGYARTGRSFGR
ncbi:hypothetical protein BN1723_016342 [Verticillium longisporum]|uniref:DUF676 domain-containing protein n=1 Tax=Verticillium longisporum TaxID=100787 RepID=A0A0G4NCT5_VERLO|nr:hypothetical protein BN1723_016342 [Verticillium longisporum]